MLLLGVLGTWVIEIPIVEKHVKLECKKGMLAESVWEPRNMPATMFVTLHVVVVMLTATLYYIVFMIIPMKFDRIKKN